MEVALVDPKLVNGLCLLAAILVIAVAMVIVSKR